MSKMFHEHVEEDQTPKSFNEAKYDLGVSLRGLFDKYANLGRAILLAILPDPQVMPDTGDPVLDEFKQLVHVASVLGEPVKLTLDDPELYECYLQQPETFIWPKSTIQGVLMGSYIGIEMHMSFREEDRPSYAEV